MCSSLPQSLSVVESEFVEFARSEKHDDQFDKGVAQCVRGANNSSDGGVAKQCCAWCSGHENVQERSERGESNRYYGNMSKR